MIDFNSNKFVKLINILMPKCIQNKESQKQSIYSKDVFLNFQK